MKIDQIVGGRGFLESPLFDPDWGLLFADSTVGGIWRLTDSPLGPTVDQVVPFRRGISGLAVHETGALIVSGRNVAAKIPDSQSLHGWRTVPLISAGESDGHTGFADMTVDRFGRVIVGTIKFAPDLSNLPTNPPAGHLICMHKDGTTEILNDKVLLSNGLGTNLDGTRLFHVDSLRHDVLVYACGADGRYEEPEVFAHIDRGLPDGLTVSRDGHVLVALAYHGGVVVLDEHGTEIDFIAVPEHMTTSLCYGGPDLSVLYVVSGFVHKSIDTEQRDGAVYGVYGAGEGKPATRATVTINDSGAVDGT